MSITQDRASIEREIHSLWALLPTDEFLTRQYMLRALAVEAAIKGYSARSWLKWFTYWYYALLNHSWSAIFIYRLAVYERFRGHSRREKLLSRLNLALNGCDISSLARIAPPCVIQHSTGVIIGVGTIIGPYCQLHGNCLFGRDPAELGGQDAYPRLDEGVFVGPGAVLIGGIEVGSEVVIGALARVTFSVPARSIVSGSSARVKGALKPNEDPAYQVRRKM